MQNKKIAIRRDADAVETKFSNKKMSDVNQ